MRPFLTIVFYKHSGGVSEEKTLNPVQLALQKAERMKAQAQVEISLTVSRFTFCFIIQFFLALTF